MTDPGGRARVREFFGFLFPWGTALRGSDWPRISPDEEPPLRAELYSAEQMEQHGRALAAAHKLGPECAPDRLLARLAANETALVGVCKLLTAAVAQNRRITPAGEWLLDNFYLIEEQIRTAKRHLPKGYSRELPRLDRGRAGVASGIPRVYDIALETVAHGDGRVDPETLGRFVAAYQSVTALKLGELWAIPIMLRLAVIENLRRVGVRIAAGWDERSLAGSWADQMTEAAEKDPKGLILVIADMARSNPPMVGAFVAELARRLKGRGPALALPLTWIEQHLAESNQTIEQLVQSENQQQATDQVSISNSIGSLRVLGAIDWRRFVESMSIVERTLLEDPGGIYGRMDFATRDRYRHATETIARKSRLGEGEVARKAIELARAGIALDAGAGCADRAGHVGFYLIGKGLPELERVAEVRLSGLDAARRTAGRWPLPLYLGAIALTTALLAGGLLAAVPAAGMPVWLLPAIGMLSLLAGSQLAGALVNWLATLFVTPHPLPRMDFSKGIPPSARTLVVVPTMLVSAASVEDLVEALEVRYLANQDVCLHFALLTDFLDADRESLPTDAPLLQLARTRIDELNDKHAAAAERERRDRFFLFHRPRRWNPQERIWMGFERKRGKLAALNALLRGAGGDGFSRVVGDTAILANVKYVITLDTDTQLPRDTARQFVGAMAHPLNRPRYDAVRQRVVEGYGILQPRVSASLPGSNRSRYARLYGGEPGIDPYTRAVSDVYQDVFGEGSFIGKGIYDVDAFEQALGRRFPENCILSHDLIEGCYVRAGLLSDVQLYEDYPHRYSADVSRRSRWIRGDWQLAEWLLRRVPCGAPPDTASADPIPLLASPLKREGREGLAAVLSSAAPVNPAAFFPLPFKGRDGVGMGSEEANADPIPHLASPLKGEGREGLAAVLSSAAPANSAAFFPLPFKGRDGVGMGSEEANADPIPLLASPLKGEGREGLAAVLSSAAPVNPAAFSPLPFKGRDGVGMGSEEANADPIPHLTLPLTEKGRAATERNPLSVLSQWKLIDNLRRSLVPTALLLLLLLGWTLLPSPGGWTLAVIGILLIPSLCAAALDLLRKPDEVLPRQHFSAVARSASRHVRQVAFELACLPYEAFFSLDAIARTLWRMSVTRRRLLEWNSSGEIDRAAAGHSGNGLGASLRAMWVAPAVAVTTAACLFTSPPAALLVAGPLLLLWLFSPVIAWWVSRPLSRREAVLSAEQKFFLGKLSRRTWAFFDSFVGADDHWLPPDNYQEYRVASIAHRTSPTNIGLGLLANLAACDFGYLPAGPLIERTANMLRTLAMLERYRGHFYNWYDTQSLQPLPPLYVSTVDSGNLAGHLLTLRAGLLALADGPILSARLVDGLGDAFGILMETTGKAATGALVEFGKLLEAASAAPAHTLVLLRANLERLTATAATIAAALEGSHDAVDDAAPPPEIRDWAQALERQCRAALDELRVLAPWLWLPAAPAGLEVCLADFADCVGVPTLRRLAGLAAEPCPAIGHRLDAPTTAAQRDWLAALQGAVVAGSAAAAGRMVAAEGLARQAAELAQMEYDFLFDPSRHLLTIGYNVGERRADSSYYDLLASEARLSSFVAIAQGQLPQESWFALGRLLTATGGDPVLLSWSGSMFEYLMPLLVMPTYDNTLLDQTCKAAVARQIEYGRQRGVPWGMSESAYNTVDVHLNYQYRAFGVPGLGLKRGLADDLVVAPYATVLALMVAPEAACANLQRLAAEGFLGRFGFFEAIDYTPARQRRGHANTVVRAFMAHHQGMSLLALAYLLLERPMQRRFESDRLFQAVMLLLQERIPKATALFAHSAQLSDLRAASGVAETPVRVIAGADTPMPEVQLLSNGRYHVMVTNAGGGYSRWKDLAVTRWREDGTCDCWGSFCYIRELTGDAGGAFWSTAHQPTLRRADSYEAIFSEGRAEFRRSDRAGAGDDGGKFETHTEIVVSPEDDIELRRVRITNRSRQRRQIELTSYAEVVIAPAAADALHPAFSNLFVQTEILRERRAILCTRRPRSRGEQAPWLLHLMAVHGAEVDQVSYETDRLRFIGRTRSAAAPLAMEETALSGSEGSVLDPIVAIRHRLTLDPEQSATIDIVTGIAESRELAVGLVEKYQDRTLADRVFDLTWTHGQVELRQLNASEADAQLHARLAGSVIFANAALRADPEVLIRNHRGQSGLWGYAISGDLPIVLLQIRDAANIELVRQLVQAHAYWRLKGLAVDLVIWNEDHNGYRQQLQEQVLGLITSGVEANVVDRPGGIFVRHADQISAEDRVLLQSVARAVITDGGGTLAEHLDRRSLAEPRTPRFSPSRIRRLGAPVAEPLPERELILGNGLGGFTPDGREYVMTLAPGRVTPAPWVNVLANPHFGTVISESGAAYTWSDNAHEFRLTPWHNDPVGDPGGEAIYLRDEETGQVWSPTPLPAGEAMSCVVRHGFGYSVFETRSGGISSELWIYVAVDAAVKFSVLKLRNRSGRARKLSVTGYVEWVLGDLRAKSAMHVSTAIDPRSGALQARNPYNTEFADRVAFFDTDEPTRTQSGDRREFLGRNGTLRNPAAMRRARLSGKLGAGLDPCAAIQVGVDLAEGQEREIVFRLGVGRNAEDAGELALRFRGGRAARVALEAVWQHWNRTLGAVQIETPDPALNVLTNGWLVYQTLACRLWARSGYYQSGGAFGFRDQLQDGMALIHAEPALVREHLLRCASRQFVEGDVQHWWHPPTGRGVRTRCSDDYLWLPLAVCRYVIGTADTGVLDEPAHFLEGRPVNPEDDSYYDLPGRSVDSASLYEHCVRAIRHGLRFGEHGLPLIGSGDWNDGMNRVGILGKGESVWLGFFLCEVLRQFAGLAQARGDAAFADLCRVEGHRLRQNIEEHGWDGQWYRRAWFDDGTPLGSAGNAECRIDSISQSWSVLSGAEEGGGNRERSRLAMNAVDDQLVRRNDALIQLLDPPFDQSALDPGYIRGYVPGVRENGGQYTHGAIWAAMAFAALGERERAWELLAMINPVNHARSPAAIATYKVEPYVMAADVYALSPHTGRGGWSWYTGSAGWMYRLIVESLLGLRLEGTTLHLAPCLPADWPGFRIHYRYRETVYHIDVVQTFGGGDGKCGVIRMIVDGVELPDQRIALVDDRREHAVAVNVHGEGPPSNP